MRSFAKVALVSLVRVLALLLGMLLAAVLSGIPASAYITAPTSMTISKPAVYKNLAETGDMAVFFHYSMPYTGDNYSTTPASSSILFRLVDSDNSTILRTGAPFVNPFFESNGYGEGTGGFYLSANETQPTWEAAAIIQIVQLPGYFSSPETETYILTASDYSSATSQDDNRELLKNYILLECDSLATSYIDTGIVLKSTSDIGVILSTYGEFYFRGVADGLQSMCPSLFFVQTLVPEAIAVSTYDTSLQTTYTNRLADDDLGEGFDRIGDLLNMDGGVVAGVIVIGSTLAASIWTARKGWGVEPGLAVGTIIMACFAIMVGEGVFTALMVVALAAAIALVYLLGLKRA